MERLWHTCSDAQSLDPYRVSCGLEARSCPLQQRIREDGYVGTQQDTVLNRGDGVVATARLDSVMQTMRFLISEDDSVTTDAQSPLGVHEVNGTARGEDPWRWLFFGVKDETQTVKVGFDASCRVVLSQGRQSWIAAVELRSRQRAAGSPAATTGPCAGSRLTAS
jgi:hypothetical protein